jgi:hypothetical protein
VGTWTDSSANAYTATQAVAGQKPIYKTNIVNGLPVVRFDSTQSQYLDLGTVLGKPGNYSTFAVFQTTNITTIQMMFGGYTSGNTHWGSFYLNLSVNGSLAGFMSDGTNYGYSRTNAAAVSANTFYYVDSIYATGNVAPTNYVNGVAPASTSYNSGAAPTTNSGAATNFAIGRLGANNSNYLAGDIAEVIIYNKTLTGTERARVEAYLKAKYGL